MKLYNAMEESYLKENLIHKWVTNIVRQNDGYEFLLDDEVYLPVYKYALKITKRKTVKLNLVEEKVLQIVSIGVHQVDEIAKILGITRPLLDVTLADLHVKDLISVSSDICSLLKKGEQALSNLERVEKQQDIMKDIYMDSFKGKILENITRYQVVEKGIIDDNKLDNIDDWAYDKNFVGKLSHYVGKATLKIKYQSSNNIGKAIERIKQGHDVAEYKKHEHRVQIKRTRFEKFIDTLSAI